MPFDPDDLNKKKGFGKGSDKPNNDDFINSSFAVQFKPGDTSNSVADKLKEGRNDTMDDFDSFKDEFDDFQIDDTISAFKPIDDKEPAKSPFSSETESQKATPAPESKPEAAPAKKAEADIPAFPKDGGTFDRKPSDDISKGPDKTNTPVFGSDKAPAKTSAPQKKDEKLFNSGKDLDYATSEHDKNKSPFANASKPVAPKADKKPEVKTYGKVSSGVNAFGSANILDEIPEVGADDNNAPSPFVLKSSPKPAAPKAPAAPAPHQAPAAAKAAQNEKHQAPATAKAQNEKPAQPHQAPAAAKAAQNEKHQAPATAKAAQNEKHQAPATAKAQNEKASQPHQAPAAAKNEKPASAPAPHTAPATAKAAQNEKSGQAEKAAPAVAAAAAAAQRPGEAAKQHTPVLTKPAPTGAAIDSIRPEDPRRVLAVEKSQTPKSSSTHERPNISPVDTVKKTRKKKAPKTVKDPGIGGLITLGVIIVAFIGILLILQNIDKISTVFGRKSVETLPTIQTTTSVVVTEPSATAETSTEVTTETTAETTTETTTETEETTTEATTAETTTETTKATSETTKKKVVTGVATKRFSTKVTNFRKVSGGFKYDIVMVNKSGKNASFKKSLKSFSVSMLSDPAPRSMSSGYLKFTAKNGMWVGTPKTEIIFKPNAKLTITVTVKTGGTADYFAYRSYNFKYN